MIDVSKEGVVGNGNDVYGQLQGIIDQAPEGSTIYFPSSRKANNLTEYGLSQPLLLTKSIHIVGASPDVTIRARNSNKLFIIEPSRENMVFSFENIEITSASIGIDFSSSVKINPISKISNISFKQCVDSAIYANMPEVNLRIENCYFFSGNYSIKTTSSTAYNNLFVSNVFFESASVAAIRMDGNPGFSSSGSTRIDESYFASCTQGVSLNNITASLHQNRYENCADNVVTSGSSQAWGSYHVPTITPGLSSNAPGQSPTITQIGSASLGLAFTLDTDSAFRVFKIPTDFIGDASFHVHWTKGGDADESGKVVKWRITYTIWRGAGGDVNDGSNYVLEYEDTYEDAGTTTRITHRTANLTASGFIPGYYASTKVEAVTPAGTPLAAEPMLLSLDLIYRS